MGRSFLLLKCGRESSERPLSFASVAPIEPAAEQKSVNLLRLPIQLRHHSLHCHLSLLCLPRRPLLVVIAEALVLISFLLATPSWACLPPGQLPDVDAHQCSAEASNMRMLQVLASACRAMVVMRSAKGERSKKDKPNAMKAACHQRHSMKSPDVKPARSPGFTTKRVHVNLQFVSCNAKGFLGSGEQ